MLMTHFLGNPNSDVAKWQAQVWEARVVIPPCAPPTPASSPPSPRLRPSPHSTKCHDERTKSRLALQTKYETIAIYIIQMYFGLEIRWLRGRLKHNNGQKLLTSEPTVCFSN